MHDWRTRLSGRNGQLDALRGIAMLAVVLNHAVLAGGASLAESSGDKYWNLVTLGIGQVGVWVSDRTYASAPLNISFVFHVALFAFVGGLLVDLSAPLPSFVYRRVQRLIVPYVGWLAISLALVPMPSVDAWWQSVSQGLTNPHSAGSLWFLPVFFICVVSSRLMVSVRVRPRALVWSAAAAIVLSLFPTAPVLRYLGDVFWLYPFCAVGAFVRNADLDIGRLRPTGTVVAGALLLVAGLAITWPPILGQVSQGPLIMSSFTSSAVFHLGRYIAASGAILCLVILTRLAAPWLRWAEMYGRKSIGVYASHSLLFGPLILLDMPWPLMFLFAAIGSLAITWIIEAAPGVRRLLLGSPGRSATAGQGA